MRTTTIAAAYVLTRLVLGISPAHAVDFSQPLKQIDGKEFSDHATLGTVCEAALGADYPDERQQGATPALSTEKYRRFLLAVKIHDHPVDPALSVEEIATIKTLVGKAYPPNIMGPAWILLDPPKNGIDKP
jgi:hypothetical protein